MHTAIDAVNLLCDFVWYFYLPEVKVVLNLPKQSAMARLPLRHLRLCRVEVILHELTDQGHVLFFCFLHQLLLVIAP